MFQSTTAIIITIASLIGAISLIWRSVIKPVWGSYRNLTKIYETLEVHLPKIIKISNELEPNGGNSIKDILNRIDKNTQGSISRIWSLLESSPFGYFETDKEGHFIKVNKKWISMANLSFDQYRGNGWINSIHYDDRDKIVKYWKECIIDQIEFNAIYTMSSGVTVHAQANPIKTDFGEVLGWIGFIEPVKEVI
jgi:PAS domain S-box-containing protein